MQFLYSNRSTMQKAKPTFTQQLTDAEWELIASYLPQGTRLNAVDYRELVDCLVLRRYSRRSWSFLGENANRVRHAVARAAAAGAFDELGAALPNIEELSPKRRDELVFACRDATDLGTKVRARKPR